jgi:hypothetical protein
LILQQKKMSWHRISNPMEFNPSWEATNCETTHAQNLLHAIQRMPQHIHYVWACPFRHASLVEDSLTCIFNAVAMQWVSIINRSFIRKGF